MRFGSVTDIGRCRKINEDSCFVRADGEFPYAMVADGMGGHQAGEVASAMAVDIIRDCLAKNLKTGMDYVEAGEIIRQAFITANSTICTYAKNNYKIMGMGTTTTLSMIYMDRVITAHVGDSRSYMISGEGIRQITRDHSYVQELVSRGEITAEEARNHPKKNYITRAMGAEETVKVDITINRYNGEKIFICTDGLTNYVYDEEIQEYMNTSGTLGTNAAQLVKLANERGGRDNITIVVLEKEKSDNEQ